MPVETMDAYAVLSALTNKHSDDLAVAECKDGKSWDRKMARLDLWVMPRSYSPLRFIGYEIKVSRQDFLRDTKWQAYLPMCNELYFATPWKLVQPEEMPEGVGLVWITKKGSRVICKRKAAHRDIEPPLGTLLYVLMSRARIVNEIADDSRAARIERYRQYVEDRASGYKLGQVVRHETMMRIRAAEAVAADAKKRADKLEWAAEALEEIGYDKTRQSYIGDARTRLKDRINRALNGDADALLRQLKSVRDAADKAVAILGGGRDADPS